MFPVPKRLSKEKSYFDPFWMPLDVFRRRNWTPRDAQQSQNDAHGDPRHFKIGPLGVPWPLLAILWRPFRDPWNAWASYGQFLGRLSTLSRQKLELKTHEKGTPHSFLSRTSRNAFGFKKAVALLPKSHQTLHCI